MALGIISDEEFDRELRDSKEIVGAASKRAASKFRGEATGISVKKLVIEEALESGDTKNAARSLGINQSTAHQYVHGRNGSAASALNPELIEHANGVRNRIITKATDTLETILGSIDEKEVQEAKLRDKTAAARDMAGIVRDMQPVKEDDAKMNVQFVLHAPALREMKEFEVVQLDE